MTVCTMRTARSKAHHIEPNAIVGFVQRAVGISASIHRRFTISEKVPGSRQALLGLVEKIEFLVIMIDVLLD